jgi:hypothetical protein
LEKEEEVVVEEEEVEEEGMVEELGVVMVVVVTVVVMMGQVGVGVVRGEMKSLWCCWVQWQFGLRRHRLTSGMGVRTETRCLVSSVHRTPQSLGQSWYASDRCVARWVH